MDRNVTAILITILYLLANNKEKYAKRLFFPLFVTTIIGISIAGHFGSVLTHGDNYITEYIKPLPKAKTITHIDSLNMYDDVVLKIFDNKCIQCHNTSKRKGELALHSKESILQGGESGDVIELGMQVKVCYISMFCYLSLMKNICHRKESHNLQKMKFG